MKNLLLLVGLLMIAGSALAAPKAKHNYACIADMLEAYNSSIYYNLSNEEIDSLLTTDRHAGAGKAREVARICDAPAKKTVTGRLDYKCISSTLEAYNSSVFYNLDRSEIDAILADSRDGRFSKVLQVSKQCTQRLN